MTREEKILKRKARRYRRIGKRIEKDRSYSNTAMFYDRGSYNLSWGRRKQHGSVFLGCTRFCEDRGYCNGDC